MKEKVLMLASVASMIDQFNLPNIELLQSMNYEVHVACNFESGNTISKERVIFLKKKLEESRIKFYQIDFERSIKNITSHYRSYIQLKKIVEKNEYKFIHSHSPIGGAIGRLVAKKTHTKIIYTAHGFHFFKGAPLKNWLTFYPIEKYLSKHTDVLITINKEDYKLANEKFKAKVVEYVPGVGIDLEKFKPISQEEKIDLRKKYSYKKSDYIIIYVGELNKGKNQEILIDSIYQLKNEIPNVKLLLVGRGSLKSKYELKISKLNLDNNIKLLGYREDVASLMNLSDVSISSSKREGLPVNVMEAMASGLPLIVSNCRGNRDLIQNNINGKIVFNDAEYKNAIIEYEDADLRNSIGITNRMESEKYSINKISEKMRKIYSFL